MEKEKIILGIETSCDDTSICILKGTSGIYKSTPKIIVHNRFSQETMLKKWGGVVPEIASRNHLAKLVPLLKECFTKASMKITDIDMIAVTTFPGLLGPLLTGLNAAKTISLIHQIPILPINHLFAHLEAIHLTNIIEYPYLGLIVSGGHSIYLLVTSPNDFQVLGSTIDDASGEAFDKGGKLLGLGYPAGQIIDQLAKMGDQNKIKFPIGMRSSANANLSFSGLKTSLRTYIEKNPSLKENGKNNNHTDHLKDVCASYQKAIVDALALKLKYAVNSAKEITGKTLNIVVGGGVACNQGLRIKLNEKFNNVHFVEPKFCTDNGAMIANYGLRIYNNHINFPKSLELDAKSRYINKGRL